MLDQNLERPLDDDDLTLIFLTFLKLPKSKQEKVKDTAELYSSQLIKLTNKCNKKCMHDEKS